MTSQELHDIWCDDIRPCATWKAATEYGERHRAYYRDKALELNQRLEPEIGTANVRLAVEAVAEVMR